MSTIAAHAASSTVAQHVTQPAHATASSMCRHCGLPIPAALTRGTTPSCFCCRGCEAAAAIIQSCDLSHFYALLAANGSPNAPPASTRRTYVEFDDPTFHSLYCKPVDDADARIELLLEGVHCSACLWLLEKLPRLVPGVSRATLDMRRATLDVVFNPQTVKLSRIAHTLATLGYPPHPARSPAARDARRLADRRMLVRIGVAGACAGNIMLLFFALYAGMFEGMDPAFQQLFRWVAMILNLVCLAWPGAVFGRSALAALRARTVHLDVPIALGLYLGGIWGAWKTVASSWSGVSSGAGDIYFDSVSALIFFLLIGRFLQQRQQQHASDALELLFSVTPAIARRIDGCTPSDEGGAAHEVCVESLRPGDIVEVDGGECIPADGTVIDGHSSIDAGLLTGESRPVAARIGSDVSAGTINIDRTLRIRVTRTGEETRIGRIMRLVEDASRDRPSIVRLADRWGAWLLWALLGLAAATLIIWWHAGPSLAIDHAISLLIATCPCGLGLATPLAMTVAIGRAARRGLLVKGGDALQTLATPRGGLIVLDKTGTLTQGRLAITSWIGDGSHRELACELARHSSHPVARAIRDQYPTQERREHRTTDITQHPGAGIEGTIDARHVLLGSPTLLARMNVVVPQDLCRHARQAYEHGRSAAFIAVDGQCTSLAILGDTVWPDARTAIESMQTLGWEIAILSGDHPDVVASIARSVGIDPAHCISSASPERKLAFIKEAASVRPVIMVGDGVNDAAALTAATVGIAVQGGAEASLSVADISIARPGLTPIVELLDGSARTMRTIHRTIASSLLYNVIAASLSMAGLITPLLAACIMPASSLTVVGLCLCNRVFAVNPSSARSLRTPTTRGMRAGLAHLGTIA